MSKVIRREFVGNKLLFWFLVLVPFFIPFAIIYLIEATVTIEDDLEDPEKFIADFREGRLNKSDKGV